MVVRPDGEGGDRLVGYVALRAGEEVDAGQLGEYVRERLPAYMAPSAYVFLERLPKTGSGKLDRKALLDMEGDLEGSRKHYVAPRTETEMRLAVIWDELLNLQQTVDGRSTPGIHDNFFDLGGHSLMAAQIVYRIRKEFANELPLRAFFEMPTIAALAAHLDSSNRPSTFDLQPATRTKHLLPIQTHGALPPLFFLAGGGGGESEYLQVYAGLIHRLSPDRPVYGFVIDDPGERCCAP